MSFLTNRDKRNLRNLAESDEHRPQVEKMLELNRRQLDDRRNTVAQLEIEIEDEKRAVEHFQQNVDFIEGLLSEVKA